MPARVRDPNSLVTYLSDDPYCQNVAYSNGEKVGGGTIAMTDFKILNTSILAGLRIGPALVIMLLASTASADAIDGDWCHAGRHLLIDGSKIVTPGGSTIVGEYDRHAFRYIVPKPESGAGENVFMVMRSEEIMSFWQTPEENPASDSKPETWRRCQNIS